MEQISHEAAKIAVDLIGAVDNHSARQALSHFWGVLEQVLGVEPPPAPPAPPPPSLDALTPEQLQALAQDIAARMKQA